MPRTAAIETLGCKVNTFESELIGESLRGAGWRIQDSDRAADLYVINTCTVTREADRQARQVVRRLVRRNPEALVVVTGCYAQMDGEACGRIPGVDLVLGNDRKLDLVRYLPDLERGSLPKIMVGDLNEHVSLPAGILTGFDARTRAFIQIQQGCNQGCMFCIIHRARGPSRSLPATLIRRQVERLVINGYREIVLCGVDLGAWGEDLGTGPGVPRLPALLRELAAQDEDFRIRLSSIDPAHIDEELIELLAQHPRLCPHLHLSLQSGNSLILKRMRRRYTAAHVYERVARLREAIPHLVLSADVMVGFPTETEAQYLDTERMVQDLQIAYPHVFPYSERDGTPAARIPANRQVPVPVRKERARRLREAGKQVCREVLYSRIGAPVRALVEGERGGGDRDGWRARGADYLPLTLEAARLDPGAFVDAVVEDVHRDRLVARVAA
ncbi:MAG: tRNA (N(6)-L-threonylcarbamoyladenosine(37)-C(2))-methylthiotransferase MtaB [Gammaproteobacteria bacterium]|nr:tRNA (N(6)-L-threonylcarbamoyladenosine(37)-C(2))-methylthiotransferase MtaB [Gammaproteobacteria bacterium]